LYRFLKPRNIQNTTLDAFKKKHPHLEIRFKAHEWPILLAYARQENMDIAANIERFNATFIMLRNISFALLLFAVVQVCQLIIHNFPIIHAILILIFLTLFIVALREAVKYNRWFYSIIYETIIARNQDLSDFLNMRRSQTEAKKNEVTNSGDSLKDQVPKNLQADADSAP
jgi:hypothetical protein